MATKQDLIQALIDALEELNDGLKCDHNAASRAIRHASEAVAGAKMLAEQLDQWQDEPTEDGWYWCEALDADAPPQLLRNSESEGWRRWEIGGWRWLTGRVCPIRRPV